MTLTHAQTKAIDRYVFDKFVDRLVVELQTLAQTAGAASISSACLFQDAAATLKEQQSQLRAIAEAARNLVSGARDLDMRHAKVDEPALVALEAALAAAGYDNEEGP